MNPFPETFTLQNVKIKNFRAVEQATIPLHPQVTVLIGDNATGKTTILEAIATALSTLVRRFSPPSKRMTQISANDFTTAPGKDLLGEPWRAQDLSIEIETTFGSIESQYRLDTAYSDKPRVKQDLNRTTGIWLADLLESNETAPVLVYYRDNRGQFHGDREPMFRRQAKERYGAYHLAFENRVYFDEAVSWFEEAENAELRDQREHGRDFRDARLSAVRRAVENLVPEVCDLRMLGRPPQLAMTLKSEGQDERLLTAGQLSSGFRTMVALAMDLARRMADLNPHLADPTQSPGVVLIDEIDLHLHPRWQQLVVKGLLEAFPNIQFIMSTHSPQVLTTLREENILKLVWNNGELRLEQLPSTEGAESGRLLSSVMGVNERPPKEVSKFVVALESYLGLLRLGKADSSDAIESLRMMQTLSPDDPILATLNLEKRRLAALKPKI